MSEGARRHPLRDAGFTLIEMLVVALFTAVLLAAAVDFYLQIARSSEAAAERVAGSRRAVLLMDRVARDLERAVLITKPPEVDPIEWPWLFLAEDRGPGEGADQLKFVSRARVPRTSAAHESDLEMVAWWLVPGGGEGYELYRWASPRLPERLDRDFPRIGDEGVEQYADGIASFGVRLRAVDGAWEDRWDSSTLARSSDLPVAAEISVALLPADPAEEEAPALVRYVLIPVRPFDLAARLAEEPENQPCVTWGECQEQNAQAFLDAVDADPARQQFLDDVRDDCFDADEAEEELGLTVQGCQ